MNWYTLLSEILPSFSESVLMLLLFSGLFNNRRFIIENKIKALTFCFLYTIVTYWATSFTPQMFHTILITAFSIVLLAYLTKVNIYSAILIIAVLLVITLITEIISMFLTIAIFKLDINSVLSTPNSKLFLTLIAKSLQFATVILLLKSRLKIDKIRIFKKENSLLGISLLQFSTTIILLITTQISSANKDDAIIYNMLMLLIVLFIAILSFFDFKEKISNIKHKELIENENSELLRMTNELTIVNQKLNNEVLLREEAEKELNKKVIELTKLKKQLEMVSLTDGLTSIPNRRYFNQVFDKECNRSFIEGAYISLIMIDVDYFKEYNDIYGHIEGDKCLQVIACELSKLLKRPDDFIARYGGEEFVTILPHVDIEGANAVAEQMRERIEELNLPHIGSKVSDYVSISLGTISTQIKDINSFEDLIVLADKALYHAKQGGRNRVVSKIN